MFNIARSRIPPITILPIKLICEDIIPPHQIKLMTFFGALFTLFHAGSKDIWNYTELMAVFIFGALSIALILYFQEAIQAIVMHIVVNVKSMGLIESLTAITSTSVIYIGVIGLVIYFLIKNKSKFRVLT